MHLKGRNQGTQHYKPKVAGLLHTGSRSGMYKVITASSCMHIDTFNNSIAELIHPLHSLMRARKTL